MGVEIEKFEIVTPIPWSIHCGGLGLVVLTIVALFWLVGRHRR
jgi:hypothetical protein